MFTVPCGGYRGDPGPGLHNHTGEGKRVGPHGHFRGLDMQATPPAGRQPPPFGHDTGWGHTLIYPSDGAAARDGPRCVTGPTDMGVDGFADLATTLGARETDRAAPHSSWRCARIRNCRGSADRRALGLDRGAISLAGSRPDGENGTMSTGGVAAFGKAARNWRPTLRPACSVSEVSTMVAAAP